MNKVYSYNLRGKSVLILARSWSDVAEWAGVSVGTAQRWGAITGHEPEHPVDADLTVPKDEWPVITGAGRTLRIVSRRIIKLPEDEKTWPDVPGYCHVGSEQGLDLFDVGDYLDTRYFRGTRWIRLTGDQIKVLAGAAGLELYVALLIGYRNRERMILGVFTDAEEAYQVAQDEKDKRPAGEFVSRVDSFIINQKVSYWVEGKKE